MVSSNSGGALKRHMDDATIVVSVDGDMPHALLTVRVLLTTLRRGLGSLVLVADGLPPAFVTEMEGATAAIDAERGLSVVRGLGATAENAVAVHVGPTVSRPAIRIMPEGYGAHVAGSPTATIRPRRPGNPLGAVYTGALGAAEVFKHTASVLPARRVLHRHLRFCPVNLTADLSAAPDLPEPLGLDLTLVGVGAIGTGIVLLLEALDAEGRIVVIDPQRFEPENVATYSIGGLAEADAAVWKVEMAERVLRRFQVTPLHERADDLVRAIDRGEVPWTPTVLTALDSAEARCDAQRLWPDRLIDAQTGDTMLGICDHRHGIDPCMICVFGVDREKPSGADAVAERLGLSVQALADPDAVLTEDDLRGKTEEQLTMLRPHLGKPMCGLAQAIGLTSLNPDGYMPSVPFVSLQAACLSIGRLIATRHAGAPASNFVQYDGLFGPQAATIELMKRKAGCLCQTRSTTIEQVRDQRRRSG